MKSNDDPNFVPTIKAFPRSSRRVRVEFLPGVFIPTEVPSINLVYSGDKPLEPVIHFPECCRDLLDIEYRDGVLKFVRKVTQR